MTAYVTSSYAICHIILCHMSHTNELSIMPSAKLEVAIAMRPLSVLLNHLRILPPDRVFLPLSGERRADRQALAPRTHRADARVQIARHVAWEGHGRLAHRDTSVTVWDAAWNTTESRGAVAIATGASTRAWVRVCCAVRASCSAGGAAARPDLRCARARG